MNNSLPLFVGVLLCLSLFITIYLFYRSSGRNNIVLYFIGGFTLVQGLLAWFGFYTDFDAVPPHFPLLIMPSLVFIILLFAFPKTRMFLHSLDTGWLTFLHIIRFPVELTLYWLCIYELVPEILTFEGRNFDIFSGITAPFVAYWAYVKKSLDRKLVLLWNVICLGLLLNVVINAILSVPSPFQMFAFDQPNVGVLYFPFVWLPSIIVPIVFLAHILCIRKLLRTPTSV